MVHLLIQVHDKIKHLDEHVTSIVINITKSNMSSTSGTQPAVSGAVRFERIKELEKEIEQQDAEIHKILEDLGVRVGSDNQPAWIWTCKKCNELNVEGDEPLLACELCGEKKIAPASSIAQVQTPQRPSVPSLTSPAPQPPVSATPISTQAIFSPPRQAENAPQRLSTWTCEACRTENNGIVTECTACFCDKPAEGGAAIQSTSSGNGWTCSACTTLNEETVQQCKICFADKEDSAGLLPCAACTTPFLATASKCPVCYAERSAETPSSTSQRGGWKCEACTTENDEGVNECSICFAEKPVAGSVIAVASGNATADEWVCVACTTKNKAEDTECSVCMADRVIEVSGPISVLDLSDGKREMLNGRRARELLSRASDPEKVTTLVFKTKSFGAEAAAVAAETLRTYRNVVKVDFSDIIAGRPTDEALGVLQTMCEALPLENVKELDLSDNAIGERGVRVLSNTISRVSKSVEVLSFRNNGLSEMALKLFVSAIGEAPNLKELHFYSNMSGNGGAAALQPLFQKLAASKAPFAFTMSSCRVLSPGTLALAKGLKLVAHRLIYLDLSDSAAGEEGGKELVETLKSCQGMKSLFLRDTGFEPSSASSLADALRQMRKLEQIDLSELSLGKRGVKTIVEALQTCSTIKVLRLGVNEAASSGLKGLLANDAFQSVEEIDLRENELDDDFAEQFARFWGNRSSLKRVELGGNDFSSSTVELLRTKFGAALGPLEGAED